MDPKVKVAAELLLYSGKSVLLAGAPGTGKTKLGFELAQRFTGTDPLDIVGRGDLASRDLLYSYEPHDKGFRIVLGKLALSILASWVRLARGLTPKWLLLDELNRMNAEIVLGSLFTALDITHRGRIAVVPRWLISHVLNDDKLFEEVVEASNIGKEVAKEALRGIIEASKRRGLNGLPLPYSWRAIATINLLDRSHLFGLGFALLRRFPIVLFPGLGRSLQPRIDESMAERMHEKRYRENSVYRHIYSLISSSDSSVCTEALRELRNVSSLITYDVPLYAVGLNEELVRRAIGQHEHSVFVTALVATEMVGIGVELGVALFADICRLLTVSALYVGASEDLIADLAVASFLLPQLGSVAPRIKSELLFRGSSTRAQRVRRLLELVEGLLGNESMAAMYAEALRLEIPFQPV